MSKLPRAGAVMDNAQRPVPSVEAPLGPGSTPTEDRYRWMVETVSEVIFEADPEGRWTYLNPAWSRLLGYSVEDCLGQPFLDYVHPDDRQRNLDVFMATVMGGKDRCRVEARYLTADGDTRHMEIHAWIFRGPDGTPLGSTGTLTDVTERHRAQAEMEERATHDPLTGLPNRALLGIRIADALVVARAAGIDLALLFLDLDRFKLVNDSLGHDAGDEVLVRISERLAERCRPDHLVARFGGDEFVVLCKGLDSAAVEALAEELRAEVALPLTVGPRELTVTASIGVRTVRDVELEHENPQMAAQLLVRDADAAMYVAKEAGRDRVAPFEDETRIRVVRQLDTESRLRTALSDGHLALFYQPQYRLADMGLVGLEALLRWVDPERGIVLPAEFIGVAEETGLITGLGNWALLEVCRQLASADAAGASLPRVSVNVSPRQLGPELVCTIEAALEETGAPPDRLCLEVTESALMSGTDGVLHSVNTLAGLGIGISLDDFGTGFSCLSYLQRLPLCELKIDRSFLSRIDRTDGHAIVAAIVRLADALDLDTVAEGVERPIEMNLLRDLGCHAVQGYLLGRPAPLEVLFPARHMSAVAQ